jgi:hypothetical protein
MGYPFYGVAVSRDEFDPKAFDDDLERLRGDLARIRADRMAELAWVRERIQGRSGEQPCPIPPPTPGGSDGR